MRRSRGMRMIRRALAATGLAVTLVAWTSTAAQAGTHDAVIKYASGAPSKLQVCHSALSTTQCASGVAWISKGQNTRTALGWKDADMFWLNSGDSAGGFHGPRWVKVAGCGGCTYSVQLN